MTDCPNAEMRDRLPDLLHHRLDSAVRAVVVAHVDGCVDCRAELELLRGVHSLLISASPSVSVSAIVAALPKPSQRSVGEQQVAGVTPLRSRAPRRTWMDWRAAATITVLVAGAGSAAVLHRGASVVAPDSVAQAVRGGQTVPVASNQAVAAAPTTTTAPIVTATAGDLHAGARGPDSTATANISSPSANPPASTEQVGAADAPVMGASSSLSGLSQRQLKALLNDIDQMQAVPLTDPAPVAITVSVKTSSQEDE